MVDIAVLKKGETKQNQEILKNVKHKPPETSVKRVKVKSCK